MTAIFKSSQNYKLKGIFCTDLIQLGASMKLSSNVFSKECELIKDSHIFELLAVTKIPYIYIYSLIMD